MVDFWKWFVLIVPKKKVPCNHCGKINESFGCERAQRLSNITKHGIISSNPKVKHKDNFTEKGMIDMLNRLMTSRRVRGFLLTLSILSAIVAALSVFIPLNQRKSAINALGRQSLSETTSIALSIEYYNGPRIQSLIDYPSTTAFYRSLCGFLARAKDTLSYDRAYILYQDEEDNIVYLADANYGANRTASEDYRKIGDSYDEERYTRKCYTILNEQFTGRRKEAFVPEILDNSYITSYLPIKNAKGEVIAILGVDARLKYSDFTRYGPINFEQMATVSGVIFLLSLMLFVLCMDKGISEEEKENRWRKRRGLPPKPLKKDKIVVDTLDDIDPNDYL